jgi:DNA processing protein
MTSSRCNESARLRPWLELMAVPGIGDATFCRLVQQFGSPEAVQSASVESLMAVERVGLPLARAIQAGPDKDAREAVAKELAEIERRKLSVLTVLDPAYPVRLKTIPDPPPLLYVSGELSEADRLAVAIVGSRHASPAGRAFAEKLSRELAAAGVTVVSGLARGVDAAAHRGALEAGGRTIAVLGCGIDRTYPSEHQALRRQIESSGAVLTELPSGAAAHSHHFPKRNRIISGFSIGVVVTEAALQSGSLITARLAAEQGREVFAVPGPVQAESSRGVNGLIKQGAKLVETVDDVLDELLPQLDAALQEQLARARRPRPTDAPRPGIGLEREEESLYSLLSFEPIHIDELIVKTGFPASRVSGLLLSLELKGAIRQLPGPACIKV